MNATPVEPGEYKADVRSNYPVKSYVVDLKDIKSIKSIYFNTYVDPAAAIADTSTTVYASVDGQTWVTLCQDVSVSGNLPKGIVQYGWNVPLGNEKLIKRTYVEDEMIAARYVRVDMELPGWGFIDEIIVPGYDGQLDGVRLADFGKDVDTTNYLTPEEAGGVERYAPLLQSVGRWFRYRIRYVFGTYTP